MSRILLQLTWSQGTVYWRPKFLNRQPQWKYDYDNIYSFISLDCPEPTRLCFWLSRTYQIMFLINLNLPDYVSDYREPTRLCFWLSWIYQIMFLIILNLPDNVSETQLATLQGLTFPFMVFKLTTFSLTKTLHLTLSIRTHR